MKNKRAFTLTEISELNNAFDQIDGYYQIIFNLLHNSQIHILHDELWECFDMLVGCRVSQRYVKRTFNKYSIDKKLASK